MKYFFEIIFNAGKTGQIEADLSLDSHAIRAPTTNIGGAL